LIPFFILTIKDIDREEVNPTLTYNLTTTDSTYTDLNGHTLQEVFEDILTDWNTQLPNGIYTYQQRLDGGAYVLDRYVQEYTLQASDIAFITDRTSFTQAYTNVSFKDYNALIDALQGNILVYGWTEQAFITTGDYIANTFSGSVNQRVYFNVPLGTTLQQAKDLLSGTKIWYELATPVLNVWSSALTVEQMDDWFTIFSGSYTEYLYDITDLDNNYTYYSP
jgi:hypothetical protein